jgi:hypothetical protein
MRQTGGNGRERQISGANGLEGAIAKVTTKNTLLSSQSETCVANSMRLLRLVMRNSAPDAMGA